jgi:hypothetical protein
VKWKTLQNFDGAFHPEKAPIKYLIPNRPISKHKLTQLFSINYSMHKLNSSIDHFPVTQAKKKSPKLAE